MNVPYPPDYVVAPVVLTFFVLYILRLVYDEIVQMLYPSEHLFFNVESFVLTGLFMMTCAIYLGYYHPYTGISLCIYLFRDVWFQATL